MDVFLRLVDGRLLKAVDVQVVKSNNPHGATAHSSRFYALLVAVDPSVRKFNDEGSARPNPLPAVPFKTELLQGRAILGRQGANEVQVRLVILMATPKFLCGPPDDDGSGCDNFTEGSR